LYHRDRHLILFPWAGLYDLHLFLREGQDSYGNQVYDFDKQFPSVRNEQESTIKGVLQQMHHLADALHWLHYGILSNADYRNRVYFAHMDLKPDNILIDIDKRPVNPSIVGRWILTDFGLSAFREDDRLYMSNFSSTQHYYERNLSMYTAPRRAPGAYQPPEVEKEDHDFRNTGIPTIKGTAGRRGDVWSFGCILAEVITFAVGRGSAVKRFRVARKGVYRTDYFYEKSGTGTPSKSKETAEYQVRTAVVNWLRTLSSEYRNTSRVVECCVQMILEILVTEGHDRPKSLQLRMMMEHVLHHTKSQHALGHSCPLERKGVKRLEPDERVSIVLSQNILTASMRPTQLGRSVEQDFPKKPIETEAGLGDIRDIDERGAIFKGFGNNSENSTQIPSDVEIETESFHSALETSPDVLGSRKSVKFILPTTHSGNEGMSIDGRHTTDVKHNREITPQDSLASDQEEKELGKTSLKTNAKSQGALARVPTADWMHTHLETETLKDAIKIPDSRYDLGGSTQNRGSSMKSAQLAIIRRHPPVSIPRTIIKRVISRQKETTPEVWSNPPPGVLNMRISPESTRWVERVEAVEVPNPDWSPKGPSEVPFTPVKYKTPQELLKDMETIKQTRPARITMLKSDLDLTVDSALCPTGRRTAFIVKKHKDYVLSLFSVSYKDNRPRIKMIYKHQLPAENVWHRVLLAGEYVVLWSKSSAVVVCRVGELLFSLSDG
jgi:serine/threonine protein kinase